MKHTDTKVYQYLIYLQKYLEGDLKKFKKLCEEAEQEEKERKAEENNINLPQTTKNPSSFDFFYEPIIARSTIPHTLSLLAVIDVLGFLLRKGVECSSDTSENFNSFFKKANEKLSENMITVLREVYRNGMIHTYFPKLSMGISCHSSNPMDKLFFPSNDINKEVILNVNKLMEIVIQTLSNIIKDEHLYFLMGNKYEKLVNLYDRKFQLAIWNLKEELKNNSN